MYNLARLRGFPAKYPGSVSSHLHRLRRTTQEAAGGALFQQSILRVDTQRPLCLNFHLLQSFVSVKMVCDNCFALPSALARRTENRASSDAIFRIDKGVDRGTCIMCACVD